MSLQQQTLASLATLSQAHWTIANLQPHIHTEKNREKVFRRFLDALGLLFARGTRDQIACTLHFSSTRFDQVILSIALTEDASDGDHARLYDASTMVAGYVTRDLRQKGFVPRNDGTGVHPEESRVFEIVLPCARQHILETVQVRKGDYTHPDGNVSPVKVARKASRQISERITTQDWDQTLNGARFANAEKVYGVGSHLEACQATENLTSRLLSLLHIITASETAAASDLFRMITCARQLYKDKVMMRLIRKSIDVDLEPRFTRLVEKLAAFGIALRHIVAMKKHYWRLPRSVFPAEVKTQILPSVEPVIWEPLPLQDVLDLPEHSMPRHPAKITELYEKLGREPLRKHAELQILEYFRSTLEVLPLLYYIGTTHPACAICHATLRLSPARLMSRDMGIISTHHWETRGISRSGEVQWAPPLMHGNAEEMSSKVVRDVTYRLKYMDRILCYCGRHDVADKKAQLEG